MPRLTAFVRNRLCSTGNLGRHSAGYDGEWSALARCRWATFLPWDSGYQKDAIAMSASTVAEPHWVIWPGIAIASRWSAQAAGAALLGVLEARTDRGGRGRLGRCYNMFGQRPEPVRAPCSTLCTRLSSAPLNGLEISTVRFDSTQSERALAAVEVLCRQISV
jgi:hypothetical protein